MAQQGLKHVAQRALGLLLRIGSGIGGLFRHPALAKVTGPVAAGGWPPRTRCWSSRAAATDVAGVGGIRSTSDRCGRSAAIAGCDAAGSHPQRITQSARSRISSGSAVTAPALAIVGPVGRSRSAAPKSTAAPRASARSQAARAASNEAPTSPVTSTRRAAVSVEAWASMGPAAGSGVAAIGVMTSAR